MLTSKNQQAKTDTEQLFLCYLMEAPLDSLMPAERSLYQTELRNTYHTPSAWGSRYEWVTRGIILGHGVIYMDISDSLIYMDIGHGFIYIDIGHVSIYMDIGLGFIYMDIGHGFIYMDNGHGFIYMDIGHGFVYRDIGHGFI